MPGLEWVDVACIRPDEANPEADRVMIRVEDVTAELSGNPALARVSFAAGEGQAVTLLGANGAGKTTMLRVLAGALRPASGTVLVGGVPADERDPAFRALVTALISPAPFAHHLTLAEHFSLIGLSWGMSASESLARGEKVMEAFGSAALVDRFPHELSSGQRQMASIALTLTRPATVILLDEPEQRLDADRVTALAGLLDDACREGATVVAATHSGALRDALAGPKVRLSEVVLSREA